MTITPNLQRQHLEILCLCAEVSIELATLNSKTNNKKLISLLNCMLGKLFIHVSIEDSVLYPKALASLNNPLLSAKAAELTREMGHLKNSALAYRESILLTNQTKNINLFINQTVQLIDLFKKRTQKEEEELYPLFSKSEPLNIKLLCRNL